MRVIERVRVPTLVLHCRDDAVVPFEEGRRLAAAIPGAEFVGLEGRNHLLLEHEPAWPRFLAEVRGFLGGEPAATRPRRREPRPERRSAPWVPDRSGVRASSV